MGQKVNPVGMRIGITKDWNSRWFASKKEYATLLNEDIKIREFVASKLPKDALLSHIEIERKKSDRGFYVKALVFVGRPGLIIGEKGEAIKNLQKQVADILPKGNNVKIEAIEVKNQNLDAKIVSEKICQQLEARASFRIVQKRALADVRRSGAKGCKTAVSGRLAGADIARTEGYKDGTMAINTLRSDIDYACSEAMTTYGKLGVKVWICRGENSTATKSVAATEEREAKKGE